MSITYLFILTQIISLKTNSGKFLTLVGSMNAGSNAKIENLQIMNNKKIFDFISKNYHFLEQKYKVEKRSD